MALRRCILRVPRLILNPPVRCGSCCASTGRSLLSTTTTTVSSSLVSKTHSPCSYALTSKTAWLQRCYSSTPLGTETVSYDQLKQILAGQKAVVFDVREPWELREYGSIPGSINVPLGQVDAALQLDPADFKEKYGGDMPRTTDNIVFSCLAGVRSKKALDMATSLGYIAVQHYPGGWQDWAEKEKLN